MSEEKINISQADRELSVEFEPNNPTIVASLLNLNNGIYMWIAETTDYKPIHKIDEDSLLCILHVVENNILVGDDKYFTQMNNKYKIILSLIHNVLIPAFIKHQ